VDGQQVQPASDGNGELELGEALRVPDLSLPYSSAHQIDIVLTEPGEPR